MGDSYYIGSHRCRRKKSQKIRIVILLSVALFLLCRFSLYPHIEAMTVAEAHNRIERIFNEKLGAELLSDAFKNEPLIDISYSTDGKVSSVKVDTVRLNLLKYRVATAILSDIGSRDLSVSLPISGLFGTVLFSWVEGEIPAKIRIAERLSASFSSDFEESGINQTRYTLSFCVRVGIYCLFPGGAHRATVNCTAPACEILIVGEVPDSFTDIDRLTDDVTEFDIDDAVDFGSVLQ